MVPEGSLKQWPVFLEVIDNVDVFGQHSGAAYYYTATVQWKPSPTLKRIPPMQVTEAMKEDEAVLRKVHHALMEVHLVEGELVCPETGRKFPVRQGVPNMLLHEDGERESINRDSNA